MLNNFLQERCGDQCELCAAQTTLFAFEVPSESSPNSKNDIAICSTCMDQINQEQPLDENHWRCLNESIWSEVPAVQVMSYRILNQLQSIAWVQDLLDMAYLEPELLEWAQSSKNNTFGQDKVIHLDSNGLVLQNGDTVVLIKDLDVKGTSFTAKRGTAVRNVKLVHDNPEYLEGKVNGQGIVILTQYVKKQV